jgi:hypothetical protein
MDIGVVSRSFPKFTNEQAAAFMAEHGFRWTRDRVLAFDRLR